MFLGGLKGLKSGQENMLHECAYYAYNGTMATKQSRQLAIRRITRSRAVGTQTQLLTALRTSGVIVNQATLSRDLVELGIRKSRGRYVLTLRRRQERQAVNLSAVVRSFTTCGPHMVVIHTAVGQAQAVAVAIDGANDASVVSTLAGDDTIFVATKSRRTQTVALRRLEQWFGEKHER